MKYIALKNFRISRKETLMGQEYLGKEIQELLRLGLIEVVPGDPAGELDTPSDEQVVPEVEDKIEDAPAEQEKKSKKKKKG